MVVVVVVVALSVCLSDGRECEVSGGVVVIWKI